MSETVQAKPPFWFWILGSVFLLWNLAGVSAFVMDLLMTDETLASLPAEQQAIYDERPGWIIIVYAIATLGGLIATLMLLMRSALALPGYGFSLLAVMLQFGYLLFGMGVVARFGWQFAIFPGVIFLLGLLQVLFALFSKHKGWINGGG